jgi:hypothetical protein
MNSVDNIPIKSEKPNGGTEGLALIVSIIALITSGLSLWDSHKAARRDDERARPALLPTVPGVPLTGTITKALLLDRGRTQWCSEGVAKWSGSGSLRTPRSTIAFLFL